MFTGLVTELGEVTKARTRKASMSLTIDAPGVARELRRGDSVAVNGVCLTATDPRRKRFSSTVTSETLTTTTLGDLREGHAVNLELPARLGDRLGGHLVQGHVDGVATVVRHERDDGVTRMWLEPPRGLMRYIVARGSITLDGVSLTVVETGRTSFQVALIPHTLKATTFARLETGARMNVEVDVIAKYISALVAGHPASLAFDAEALVERGGG